MVMDESMFHELAIFGAEDTVPHLKQMLISKGDQHLLSDRKDKHLVKETIPEQGQTACLL